MTTTENTIDSGVSPFNPTQRQRLRDLSKVLENQAYSAQPNAPLEEYLEVLRDMYPEKFHNKESLKLRVFMDTPTTFSTPYARCVRPRDQSPIYLKGLA
jgi:hypothetical protein